MSAFITVSYVSGGIPGTAPAVFACSTEDNLATITASGYLNDMNDQVKQNDIFHINYSDTSTFPLYPNGLVATLGTFYANVSGANTSLIQFPSTTNIPSLATVAVSAAEFNGMYAAPKLLVAAPGANNLILVNKMDLIMTYGTAAFASGGVVAAQYDSTVNGAGVKATNTEAAADFFATESTTYQFEGVSGNTVGALPFATTVNKGIYLSNQTGAFTTGDSTFVAKIWYYTVAVA